MTRFARLHKLSFVQNTSFLYPVKITIVICKEGFASIGSAAYKWTIFSSDAVLNERILRFDRRYDKESTISSQKFQKCIEKLQVYPILLVSKTLNSSKFTSYA